jgi:hypothetical protein
MNSQKISQPLADQLEGATQGNRHDVIVELAQPLTHDAPEQSRAANIAARKQAFTKTAEPVESLIQSLGGVVTDRAWINGSIRARIDEKAISALSAENDVMRLDVPHPLKADTTSPKRRGR